MLGGIEGRRRRGWQAGWHHWLDGHESWVNSGSWWWTGRPGVLRLMGSQRVGHNWVSYLIWSRGQQVIFHQLHNWSAAMAGGREHSDRKATRFQRWSISDKRPVSYQERLGQRRQLPSPLQADGFFCYQNNHSRSSFSLKEGWIRGWIAPNLFKSLLVGFLMSTHIIPTEVPRSSCK